MRILVNGEASDVQGARNVAELVERLGMPSQSILIEHNETALHPREWRQQTLTEGDRIEILRVVAGG